jgi:small subunit ribosomal protein S16
MLKIRLRRVGAKKQPAYRVVVAESSAPRDGRFVEIIGHYNPLTNPSTVVIDTAKADKWIRNGAQPTDRVAKLLAIARAKAGATAPAEADETAPAAAEPVEPATAG